MPTQDELNAALEKANNKKPLTDTERRGLEAAGKQAGNFGGKVRKTLGGNPKR